MSQPTCRACGRVPADPRFDDSCDPCYRHRVERTFLDLPLYPNRLRTGPDTDTDTCNICTVRWPTSHLFRDAPRRLKCVLCRRWELMHNVEQYPGVCMRITVSGPGRLNKVKCFHCGMRFAGEQYKVPAGGRWATRESMFCRGCRWLEERYVQQGFIEI
jgi:hypothetical protein